MEAGRGLQEARLQLDCSGSRVQVRGLGAWPSLCWALLGGCRVLGRDIVPL